MFRAASRHVTARSFLKPVELLIGDGASAIRRAAGIAPQTPPCGPALDELGNGEREDGTEAEHHRKRPRLFTGAELGLRARREHHIPDLAHGRGARLQLSKLGCDLIGDALHGALHGDLVAAGGGDQENGPEVSVASVTWYVAV